MKNNESGFTLIELMVATAMVTIVVGVIYAAYNLQTKIYTEQGKVAEMQQNIRAGMWYLQRELRMAGYGSQDTKDPSCNAPGETAAVAPGIHTAEEAKIGFSMDLNENGDCADDGENVTYSLYDNTDGIPVLGRDDNTDAQAKQSVAEYITSINFIYIFSPPLMSLPATDPTSTPTPAQLDDIAAVQVSMLARASSKNRTKASTTSFTIMIPDAWGVPTAAETVWGPYTDSYSRRLLTTTINCRNMGLL